MRNSGRIRSTDDERTVRFSEQRTEQGAFCRECTEAIDNRTDQLLDYHFRTWGFETRDMPDPRLVGMINRQVRGKCPKEDTGARKSE